MSDKHEKVSTLRHAGKGRERSRTTPKGRQVLPGAREQVQDLLSGMPRRRDMLIEHLHCIQDHFGSISIPQLAALAEFMGLPQSEVFETATFYAHFNVLKPDQRSGPEITVRVCDSLSCAMAGSESMLQELGRSLGGRARVLRAPCMGRCQHAPVVAVQQNHLHAADVPTVAAAVEAGDFLPHMPRYRGLDEYLADGGYRLLGQCLDGERTPGGVIEILQHAGLRGLGGAGFPTGVKWRTVRSYPGPRLVVVNADEGEPGTFKDKHYLETNPHRVLEGALIAAWAVEADTVYIYLRDEYPAVRQLLQAEIGALEASGAAPHARIELRRGAGAYICGEESAMIESIEGKRALPRHRPPYVAQKGLFGRPTLVNNVETLYWIRDILDRGPDWFVGQGRHGGSGLRSYSVSGRVKEPGLKLAPAGITARELIDEYCGGMLEGHHFRAYLPGGASGGILPASKADLPLEFGALEENGCFVGSHAVVVLSDRDDLRGVALNLMRFFADESCGQCTPCRVGTQKAVSLMDKPDWDPPAMEVLGRVMADASICGLGQAAANPMMSILRYFPEELEP